MFGSSLPAVLRERASLQPNETAFTFIDYEQDYDGVSESLTWSQLYRRSLDVASELGRNGTTGDRAVILAPQGLDYITAFLGVLQAGHIAVPLSVPVAGVHDERVASVLSDASPATILTTSAFAGDVAEYADAQHVGSAAAVIAVDSLDVGSGKGFTAGRDEPPTTAYLQYTSGSTRTPAGVVVSHRNLSANFEQVISDLFADHGKVAPPNTTAVSWLPFYHDMGLVLGVCAPILGGWRTVVMSPLAFLARPARWMQLLAGNSRSLTAGPNFAFELAAGRTSDDDMAGLDLGGVLGMICGSERVHATTLRRFTDRFARFNLSASVIRPSYGLAEATVYAATAAPGRRPNVVAFDPEKLSTGHAKRSESGTPLVSYGTPVSPAVRIVDPETGTERQAGNVGEIWLHGENVCAGYWRKPRETEQTFGGTIVSPSVGTPEGPWLRTGDLGFISEDELFIIGRIKDLLIVRGRNHYPDDIEATIQAISRGRVAAISVPDDRTEKLVAIVELKNRGASREDWARGFDVVKRQVTSAVSTSHGLSVSDLVLVQPGSIPITTSGKVRRAACVEQYRHEQFTRIDA
jgi:fatty acid CoA ligase FadD28